MKYFVVMLGFSIYVATIVSCDKGDATDPSSHKYFPQVKTIIENNCLSCHSSAGSWEGRPTAFDNDTAIAQQYMAIKAAVADPVTPVNKRMPQGGMLSDQDLDIIVKWFDRGGKIID